MRDGVDVVTFESYCETVVERLEDRDYVQFDDAPANYEAIVRHRREGSLLPPGTLDFVVVVARFATPAIETIREFSSRVFNFVTANDAIRTRWVGNIPMALPVAACENPGIDLKRWIAGYRTTHRRAYEFPTVVDMTMETVHYYTDTPLLEKRAYERFRKLSATVLDPSTTDLEFDT